MPQHIGGCRAWFTFRWQIVVSAQFWSCSLGAASWMGAASICLTCNIWLQAGEKTLCSFWINIHFGKYSPCVHLGSVFTLDQYSLWHVFLTLISIHLAMCLPCDAFTLVSIHLVQVFTMDCSLHRSKCSPWLMCSPRCVFTLVFCSPWIAISPGQ